MRLRRREVLRLATGATDFGLAARPARAEAYPARPVSVIVGFPNGGSADIVTRLVAQALGERLGQPFIVDNRAGAGSNIGTEAVVRASPDGYTLLSVTSANAINTTLYRTLSFDIMRDLVPVASIDVVPQVMDVNPSVPVRTIPEFVVHAKANPGELIMGSGGVGSSPHMAGELFKLMAGVDMLHVPYRGVAPATADLLAGQIQVLFDTVPAAIGNIRAGRVRALAVTTSTRSDALPDVPAMAEFLPGYEASSFHGIAAPKDTPAEIVDTLNRAINAALAQPKLRAQLADLGGTVLPGTPADFGRLMAEDIARWGRVVAFSGAKAE